MVSQSWILETDAINVVLAVQACSPRSPEANIILDIANFVSKAYTGNVCYIPRSRNQVANYLTNLAFLRSTSSLWIDVIPLFIRDLIPISLYSHSSSYSHFIHQTKHHQRSETLLRPLLILFFNLTREE